MSIRHFFLNAINVATLCLSWTALLFGYIETGGVAQSGYHVLAYHARNHIFHPLYFCLLMSILCAFFTLSGMLESALNTKKKKTHNGVIFLVLLCALYMIFGLSEAYLCNGKTGGEAVYKTQTVFPFVLACILYVCTFLTNYVDITK